jgi:predicted nucleotidyltransferase
LKGYSFSGLQLNENGEESDVDLIVISNSFRGLSSLERAKMLLEDWSFVEELDLLMYTPEEFDKIRQRLLVREMLAHAVDLTPNRVQR